MIIQNKKKIPRFIYIKSIFCLLTIFVIKVEAETKIIARDGDTLFKISKQYGVSLRELMHKNNFNDASRIIKGEVILIPQKNNQNNNDNLNYKIKEGDTLYKIARLFNTSLQEILYINNLDSSSTLKPNQIILLPKGATYKKIIDPKSIKLANKKVSYHRTTNEEELSKIADIHKIPKEDIITLNNLDNSTIVNPNIKLKIRAKKSTKWLKYGLLTINWSDWSYLDGNYVTQAKNKNDRSFYIAINCEKRALNNTLKTSFWKSWYFPKSDFEFKLIKDFCDQDFKI